MGSPALEYPRLALVFIGDYWCISLNVKVREVIPVDIYIQCSRFQGVVSLPPPVIVYSTEGEGALS